MLHKLNQLLILATMYSYKFVIKWHIVSGGRVQRTLFLLSKFNNDLENQVNVTKFYLLLGPLKLYNVLSLTRILASEN